MHGARREQLGDQLAQAGVLRRIVVDQQRLGDLDLIGGHVVFETHDDAVGVGFPVLVVLGDLADMGVLGDHPVPAVVETTALAGRLGIPPDRRGLAQLRELLHGDSLLEQIGVGEIPPLLLHERALRDYVGRARARRIRRGRLAADRGALGLGHVTPPRCEI